MGTPRRFLDYRDMKAAYVVSDENGYYDSQNIISVFDKNIQTNVLSCVLHHSRNHEGGKGLTLCSTRSIDGGKTWSKLKPIELPETIEDCKYYGIDTSNDLVKSKERRQSHDGYQLLIGERIYLFYGWNRGQQPLNGPHLSRTDMQLEEGFWMRWSDDYGETFNGGRALIPVRRTKIDRNNPWKGEAIGAFCCDKPQIINGEVMFAFQKTPDGNGESYSSEVFFMRSKNFMSLHNKDAMHSKGNNIKDNQRKEFVHEVSWETMPIGEEGLQTISGLHLGEEPHILQIHGSRLLCFWRTDLGFLDSSYSDDNGRSWSSMKMRPLAFHPGLKIKSNNEQFREINDLGDTSRNYSLNLTPCDRKTINNELIVNREKYLKTSIYADLVISDHNIIRNPRGAITPIRLKDDSFALLFYNNGHTDKVGYVGRLVYWLTLGIVNTDGNSIVWSQPELVLWWDGILLDNREDWNEDWAIVDGAGYADFQEMPNGNLAFVESNKLTVRYHEIPCSVLEAMKTQLKKQNISQNKNLAKKTFGRKYQQDLVYDYLKEENVTPPNRAPVLPDLRSGGGFTLSIAIDFGKLLSKSKTEDEILIRSFSTVSGALDEEAAPDITKGYEIVLTKHGRLRLSITDGFKTSFDFEVDFQSSQEDYYKVKVDNKMSVASFIVDGGPKVVSCVINDRLYNAFPSGWKFFPREFGEIGGSNINIVHGLVEAYNVYDRALLVSECIDFVQ